jgi:hypothetical protein
MTTIERLGPPTTSVIASDIMTVVQRGVPRFADAARAAQP